ncbi:MAG: hypothetical protein GF308_10675 [Candidatus Heimdallarchaeota archaeon]|nr:hypothetical protein [Candidatus Heimdallarchaeota archaeon]
MFEIPESCIGCLATKELESSSTYEYSPFKICKNCIAEREKVGRKTIITGAILITGSLIGVLIAFIFPFQQKVLISILLISVFAGILGISFIFLGREFNNNPITPYVEVYEYKKKPIIIFNIFHQSYACEFKKLNPKVNVITFTEDQYEALVKLTEDNECEFEQKTTEQYEKELGL